MILVLAILLTILTPLYLIYRPPQFVIRYVQRRWPKVLWQVSTVSKVVALTIDDGPSLYTREILSILQEYDATATFFIIGSHISGAEEENILKELISAGCELGNHTMEDKPSRSLRDTQLADEIHMVEERLRDAYSAVGIDGPPRYFRPGSGFFSTRMQILLRKLNYRLVLGSIYPHDPQIPLWRLNAHHILSMLRPGGIIVCHDGRSWTAPMLRKILSEIRSRGYRVVTVSELLKEENWAVQSHTYDTSS